MNNDSTDLHEEPLGPQMLDLDEQLAQGLDEASTGVWPIPESMQPRWERLKACVQLLRQALTPGSDAGPTSGRPADEQRVGATFGRFHILRELGRGGFGIVFLADDPELNRKVALKVPRPEALDNAGLRVRFLREARATAALDHPNLVAVYEAGQVGPVCYIASAYCPGISLAAWLQQHPPFAPRTAAALVARLAAAVQHAHERGILHRDIKPSNILLVPADAELVPKLTDFGLAKLLNADSELTASSAVLGTPQYMAPEQMGGANPTVGPAADVYALGTVLFEMLTGQPPFRGSNALETLDLVRTQEPALPTVGQNKIPPDLSTICLKCLRKDPQRRYPTALELAEDLERFLSGRPIQARPVGSLERAWRWSRRNPGWAAMLATTATLLLILAVGASLMSLSLTRALAVAESARKRGDDALWVSYLDQAEARRMSRAKGQRFQSLAAIRKALTLAVPADRSLSELRNAAIACLVLPDLETAQEWAGLPGGSITGVENCVSDASLKRYARWNRDGDVFLCRAGDGSQLMTLSSSSMPAPNGMAFSPDGRFLQHRCVDGRLKLWRLNGKASTPVLEVVLSGPPDYQSTGAFSTDSRLLAVAQADGQIIIYETATGAEARRFQTGYRPYLLAFRPGRAQLAVAEGNNVHFLGVEPDAAPLSDLSHPAAVTWIDWRPDGQVLASSCNDLKIHLWDVTLGKRTLPPLEGNYANGMRAMFNHAGDRLVSNDWFATCRLWETRSGRQLLSTPSTAKVFGPDDQLLAWEQTGSRLRLLRVAHGRELRTLVASNAQPGRRVYTYACNSPDGRFLLVNTRDSVCVLDWTSGAEVASLPLLETRAVGFDTQGALLTSGGTALHRWPTRTEPATGRWHIGPPERLAMQGEDAGAASGDGQVVAIPNYRRGALVLHRPDRWMSLGPSEDVRYCAVSSDGRWIATGNHWNVKGVGATIWDAETGKKIKDLHVGGICHVGFSPDGKQLVTTGGGYCLWKSVGATWEEWAHFDPPSRVHSGGIAYSPDGKVLALSGTASQILLVDPDSGSEFARLTAPDQTPLDPTCFSRDGTRLVAFGPDNGVLYIWDLRAIRAQLQDMHLDWNMPEYPPAAPPEARRPLVAPVQIDLGNLQVPRH